MLLWKVGEDAENVRSFAWWVLTRLLYLKTNLTKERERENIYSEDDAIAIWEAFRHLEMLIFRVQVS